MHEALVKREAMNVQHAEFMKSSAHPQECPPPERPEYAFIGRSNVGKSSLINMLTNRNSLAKISSTPGTLS
jgi:GTP-binding protein